MNKEIINRKRNNSNKKSIRLEKDINNKKDIKKAELKTAYNKRTSHENCVKNNVRSISKAKKKKEITKQKKVFVFIFIIIILILILTSSLFNVKEVIVVGNSKLSTEEIVSLSKIEKHANIFQIDKLQSIDLIKENAYIENVEIKRKLPNKIEITIQERVPKYMLQFADSYVYINNQGYMLEISNEKLEIPVLIGVTTDLSNIKAGNRMNLEDLKKMDNVIEIYETAKRNEIEGLITKIDISNEKNYTVILETEGKTVYLGDCTELNTKMLYLKEILNQEQGNRGEIFLNIDLNEQRVRFREST